MACLPCVHAREDGSIGYVKCCTVQERTSMQGCCALPGIHLTCRHTPKRVPGAPSTLLLVQDWPSCSCTLCRKRVLKNGAVYCLHCLQGIWSLVVAAPSSDAGSLMAASNTALMILIQAMQRSTTAAPQRQQALQQKGLF